MTGIIQWTYPYIRWVVSLELQVAITIRRCASVRVCLWAMKRHERAINRQCIYMVNIKSRDHVSTTSAGLISSCQAVDVEHTEREW